MGKRENEPKLVSSQFIERLINKGITFDLITEDEAVKFLEQNSNYFKLTSYRKNFSSNIIGGKRIYSNLDFKHLVELSKIDMVLRYQLVKMCLDIEHSLKVKLMNAIENDPSEDGYTIIENYFSSQNEETRQKVLNEIKRNSNSIYYHKLLKKHNIDWSSNDLVDFPVWAFMEVISFGSFLDFYYKYFMQVDRKNAKYIHLLNNVKQVRNASAHNTCMLNNLYANSSQIDYSPSLLITSFVGNAKISETMRKSKISNNVLYQITSVFYIHNKYVSSNLLKAKRYKELFEIMESSMEVVGIYFAKNDLITSSMQYLHKIARYLSINAK